MARHSRASTVAGFVLVGLLLGLATGCAAREEAPASIQAWQEPTQTSAAPSADPATVSAEATGAMGQVERTALEKRVSVLSVGYAAEGGYLVVNLTAPPRLAMLWQPSEFSITDESTGAVYDNVPLMPKVGFLIGRPATEGQIGYVMLENKPYLKPGSRVTVRVGGVVKEHMLTQTSQETTVTAP